MVGNVISNKGKGIIECNGGGIIRPNATPHIYGAEWAGTSSPAWTRTDSASSFSDPNPYYVGMSGTPSSPFDDILPWAGMRRVTDPVAGELVEIPKFYYKWTRTGSKMKLQISMYHFEGFYTSPAHADRGDGVGERDYVYVGRYHCASDYKSKTGVLPKVSTSRVNFSTGIHNLRSDCYQYDYASIWTIRMLYLVEFANWDCQSTIGRGCSVNQSIMTMGYTDSLPYHSGTDRSSRTTYGGTQYRYIEGLWDSVWDFVGNMYGDSSSVYIITNPANYSASSGGVKIGNKQSNGTWGYITEWKSLNVPGLEYALYPYTFGYSYNYYVTDTYYTESVGTRVITGGNYDRDSSRGLFCTHDALPDSTLSSDVSARLQVLPSTRIS